MPVSLSSLDTEFEVTVFPNNNVLVQGGILPGGIFELFGADPLSDYSDFLVFTDRSSGIEWSTLVTGTLAWIKDVHEFPDGDMLVQVSFQDSCSFLDTTITAPTPATTYELLVRITQQGTIEWIQMEDAGSSGGLEFKDFMIENDGSIKIIGRTVENEVYVGGITLPAMSTLLLTIDLNGDLVTFQSVDPIDTMVTKKIPLENGNYLAFGSYSLNASLGPFQLMEVPQQTGGLGIFMGEVTLNGEWQWARTIMHGEVFFGIVQLGYDSAITMTTSISATGFINNVPYDSYSSYLIRIDEGCLSAYSQASLAATCPTINDGGLQVEVVGGLPPYSFVWDDGATTATRYGLAPGVYHVLINDSDTCTTEFSGYVPGPGVAIGQDASSMASALPFFRPGLTTELNLFASALGCDPVDGQIQLILDPLLELTSTLTLPDQVLGDTVLLQMGMLSFDAYPATRSIEVETDPSASIGDTICIQVLTLPIDGDVDPSNNEYVLCAPVVNSYDPNDKQVWPAGSGPQGYVDAGTRLTYMIRFQNTGNAPAFNVFIDDTLHAGLEINGFQLLGQSHPMTIQFLDDRVIRFRFDNILLPDSMSDEANSHGYVLFSIPMHEDLAPLAEVTNTAYIYFDLNPAVVTNTTINTVSLNSASNDLEPNPLLRVWPNPAEEMLYVETSTELIGKPIYIVDLQGRRITVPIQHSGERRSVNVSQLSQGTYFVQIDRSVVKFTR